jgi:hypothetical protein
VTAAWPLALRSACCWKSRRALAPEYGWRPVAVGPCGTADLELTIADIAKGIYTLNSSAGVTDLGASFAGAVQGSPRASSEVAGIAGHSYAVQLGGGRTAVITIDSIRNPGQLDAAARAVFRNSATLVLRSLASDSVPTGPGSLAGGLRGGATVFVQLTVQTPQASALHNGSRLPRAAGVFTPGASRPPE